MNVNLNHGIDLEMTTDEAIRLATQILEAVSHAQRFQFSVRSVPTTVQKGDSENYKAGSYTISVYDQPESVGG